IKHTHAAVGVVVCLWKELSLVKNIPVLIAIDQYNSWFTFSEYEEAVKVHSQRPVHARELTMHQRCYLPIFEESPHTTENMSATAIHGGKEGKICNEQNGQGPQNTTDPARPMLKVYRLYND
ncbi:hypothetical protein CMV_030648, partial [Castanea mollissima]